MNHWADFDQKTIYRYKKHFSIQCHQFRVERLSAQDPKKPQEWRDQRCLKNVRFSFDIGMDEGEWMNFGGNGLDEWMNGGIDEFCLRQSGYEYEAKLCWLSYCYSRVRISSELDTSTEKNIYKYIKGKNPKNKYTEILLFISKKIIYSCSNCLYLSSEWIFSNNFLKKLLEI